MTSHNPEDAREGYCGNCHDWTSMPPEKPGPHVHLPSSFVEVRGFPDMESAWNAMRADEARANANVTVEQGLIGWGDYFEVPPELNRGLHAWGHVMSREDVAASEREAGADEAEVREVMARMDNSYARGYRFSWSYSAPYPEGELGSVHVSTMRKVTKDEYAAAQADGWR